MTTADQTSVLFFNAAFYTAFATRDIQAMEQLWSKDKTIICTHPGWQPLTGREEVLESWRNILSNPEAPEVACHGERAVVYGDFAIVTCIEQLSDGQSAPEFLTATNVFVRAGTRWVLVHHQAGPANVDARTVEKKEKPALN